MREILFKAKRKDNGEWVYGDFSHTPDGEVGIEYTHKFFGSGTRSRITMLVDPETVCQYTGLVDKNGKKIFEGDIVKGKDSLARDFEVYGHIEHRDGSFVIVGEFFTHYRWLDYDVEVIGNIFDGGVK